MRPVHSSKFPVLVLIAGPTGTLATAGVELAWSDLAIAVVTDGAGVTGPTVSGSRRGRSGRRHVLPQEHLRIIDVVFWQDETGHTLSYFHPQQEEKSRVSLHKLWLPLHACDHDHVLLDSFHLCIPCNGTKNACWHFLASLPSLEIESIPSNGTRNASWYFLAPSLRYG